MNKLNWVFLRDSFGLNVSFPRWGGEGQVYGICLKYRFLKECSFFIYGFYGNIIVSKLAYHIYMSSQFYFFVLFTQITSPRVRYHSFSDLFMYQMYQKNSHLHVKHILHVDLGLILLYAFLIFKFPYHVLQVLQLYTGLIWTLFVIQEGIEIISETRCCV